MNFNGIRILGNYVTTIALLLSIIANKSKLLNFCAQMPLPLPLSASLCLSLPWKVQEGTNQHGLFWRTSNHLCHSPPCKYFVSGGNDSKIYE